MIGYTMNELYVGDLDPNVTEEILFNAFSRFGQIFSLKVMRHIVTGASRGFAFINFMNVGQALRAKNQMNGEKFFGKVLRVYLKSEYDSLDPNANIVFQNLPNNTSEETVLKLLKPFGSPFSVKIVKNEKNAEETKAFVQFDKLETAKRVIEELNGTQFDGKELLVELTNRKNKVFLKAKYHDTAIEELRKTLEGWKYEESESPEISSDRIYFIILLKFENEQTALAFLEDYRTHPGKCGLTRPAHSERRRKEQLEGAEDGLFKRELKSVLPSQPLPRARELRPVQKRSRAKVRPGRRREGLLTS